MSNKPHSNSNDLPSYLDAVVSNYLNSFENDDFVVIVLQKEHLRHFGFDPSEKLIMKYTNRKITIFPLEN